MYLGDSSIRSCGSIPFTIFVAHQDSRALSLRPRGNLGNISLKECAGLSTQAKHVKEAASSTSVTNAEKHTQLVRVAPVMPTLPKLTLRVREQNRPFLNPQAYLQSPLVTPVKLERLQIYLAGYDRALKEFLTEGFRVGFSIPFFGERSSRELRNLKSAIDNPAVARAKLAKELKAG